MCIVCDIQAKGASPEAMELVREVIGNWLNVMNVCQEIEAVKPETFNHRMRGTLQDAADFLNKHNTPKRRDTDTPHSEENDMSLAAMLGRIFGPDMMTVRPRDGETVEQAIERTMKEKETKPPNSDKLH